DDADFVARFNQAEAVVATEEAILVTYDVRRFFQMAMINQAAASMHAVEAEVNRANLDQQRYQSLINSEVATKQRYEQAIADATKAAASLVRSQSELQAQKEQLAVIDAQKHEDEAKLSQARAALRLAHNQLNDTIIRAPVDGIIGNRAGQTGQYVKA